MKHWREMGHTIYRTYRADLLFPPIMAVKALAFRPDIVWTWWLAAPVAVFLRQIGIIRVPVVHSWEDPYDEQSSLPAWLVRPLERYSVRHADMVVSASAWLGKRAIAEGVAFRYIPGASDRPNPDLADYSVLVKGKFKIVYVGDQSPYKKTSDLVNAVRGLECDLYLFGPINADLAIQAPDNVHFMGVYPQSEMPAIYNEADLLVQTADQDSTLKIREYIRAHKPILARAGRIEHYLTHSQNCYLTRDFRSAIMTLMDDASLRIRIADGTRKLFSYDNFEVAMIYSDLFEGIIRRGATAMHSSDISDAQYKSYLTNEGKSS